MPVRLESEVEKEVCRWAKFRRILPVKFTPMGEAGWPDRVFLYAGRVAFIEFKQEGKKARPLQQHRIDTLRVMGFMVEVHDNVDSAIAFLDAVFFSRDGSQIGDFPSLFGAPTPPGGG